MKKIDLRSMIIGFLLAVIFFLMTGQSKYTSAVYDSLTVKNLKVTGLIGITSPDGKLQIGLSSRADGGAISLYDNNEQLQLFLSTGEYGSAVYLFNKLSKGVASIQSNKENDGTLILYDKDGVPGWAMSGKQ